MNYGRREQEGLAGPDVPDSAGAFGAVRRLREENGYLEDVRHRESPGEISRRERETVKKNTPYQNLSDSVRGVLQKFSLNLMTLVMVTAEFLELRYT